MIKFQIRYAKLILVIGLLLFAALAVNLRDFEIDPSFSSLISSDTEYNTNERTLSNVFPSNNQLTLFAQIDENSLLKNKITDLDSAQFFEYEKNAKEILSESQYVRQVLPATVSENGKYAKIPVTVFIPRNNQGFRLVIDDLEYYIDEIGSLPGVDITLTGFPLLLNRINRLIINDNMRVIALTFVALFFGLFWYFRNIRLTLITMSIPVISLVSLASLMAIFNIPLTITLAAVGIIMLGIGVDYTIHVMLHYEEYLVQGKPKAKALIESIKHLWKAIVTSFVTTLAGFSALLFGVSPSSQDQGLALSLGIVTIFTVTMLLLPPIIYLFGANVKVKENDFFKRIKQYLIRLSHYQTHHPWTVLGAIFVVSIVMFIGMTQVQFSTSNNNWIADDDPVQEAFRATSLAFGSGIDSLTLVLESRRGDLRDVQTVDDIQMLKSSLLAEKKITNVITPFDDVQLRQPDIYERAKERQDAFTKDYTLTQMRVQATNFGGEESGDSDLLTEIRDIIDEQQVHNTDISLFGDVVRFQELGESLQKDTGFTTMISLVLVFLLASIAYASFTIGMIALLPIIVGLIWTVGLMGFLGVPFNSLSTGLVALVLGIGVDFSIHLVNSTYNYFFSGESLDTALDETIKHTGTPILLSSISTFIGFISLVAASLLGIRRLGMSLGISIVSVFLVTIIMVPAILSIQLRKKRKSVMSVDK